MSTTPNPPTPVRKPVPAAGTVPQSAAPGTGAPPLGVPLHGSEPGAPLHSETPLPSASAPGGPAAAPVPAPAGKPVPATSHSPAAPVPAPASKPVPATSLPAKPAPAAVPAAAAAANNNGFDGLAEGPEGDQPMSFWDHLTELRNRLIKAFLGLVVACILCFVYATELREFLAAPLHTAWAAAGMPGKPELQVLAMMDAFMTDMRVAVAAGIFLSAPVGFYQLWMFIAPGLYAREKRYVIPFVACSVFMFLAGAAFCYKVVLPWTIQWLISYTQGTSGAETTVAYHLTLNDYIRDATKILVAFGAVFEFPLLVAFLSFAGVLDHRTLLRFWKISVILIFVIAAVLTPPEPVSQLMMAFPMVGLFFLSVGVSYLITRGRPAAPPVPVTSDEPE